LGFLGLIVQLKPIFVQNKWPIATEKLAIATEKITIATKINSDCYNLIEKQSLFLWRKIIFNQL